MWHFIAKHLFKHYITFSIWSKDLISTEGSRATWISILGIFELFFLINSFITFKQIHKSTLNTDIYSYIQISQMKPFKLVIVITCLRGKFNEVNFPQLSSINMWFLVNHMWKALKEHTRVGITQKTINQYQQI